MGSPDIGAQSSVRGLPRAVDNFRHSRVADNPLGLCASRPAEHWDTGDDGNRLALLLCDICPARIRCPQADPRPHGVIRAAVAYDDKGHALDRCHCGYPRTSRRPGHCCRWCSVHTLPALPRQFYFWLRYKRRRTVVVACKREPGNARRAA